MRKVLTFEDGSIYVQRPGSRWGRVNISPFPIIVNGKNEVCYIPVADAPISTDNKGSTIPFPLRMFDYWDNFHTKQASNWARTPWMLLVNRPYVGDPFGSTLAEGADPTPRAECITCSCNILRVLDDTPTHYEIEAWPLSEDIRRYDPAVFNWRNFPWIFWKATARTWQGQIQNVGAGLDVYHMNFRKPQNKHYIHKSRLSLFTIPPFTVTHDDRQHTITDYQFIGASIWGITDQDKRVPLLIAERPGQADYPTEWRGPGQTVVPPA
jgi:hypothetical protein